MTVKAIPEGYQTVVPYLSVDGAAEAIDFYRRALGAEEVMRLPAGDKIAHAELQIGDCRIMLADDMPGMADAIITSPSDKPAVGFMIYVSDVDAAFARAIDAGATTLHPVTDQFYGDRSGTFRDPLGHVWTLATHVEDVSEEEIEKRMAAMGG
jgi:PhnB protein